MTKDFSFIHLTVRGSISCTAVVQFDQSQARKKSAYDAKYGSQDHFVVSFKVFVITEGLSDGSKIAFADKALYLESWLTSLANGRRE